MTVRDILLVHMYLHPSVIMNACYHEIYLQYVYYNLLARILFFTSSYILVLVLYNSVQNKIKKTEHLCRLCEEEEETFDHFVNNCPCLRQAIQDHFGLNEIEKSHGWTIKGILEYSRIKVIDLALKGEDSSNFSTD